MSTLSERIESEAAIAARPGQCDRLLVIAAEVEAESERVAEVREQIAAEIEGLAVDIDALDPWTEGVRDAARIARGCSHCPPGCKSCWPPDCECYAHQDEPDRRMAGPNA